MFHLHRQQNELAQGNLWWQWTFASGKDYHKTSSKRGNTRRPQTTHLFWRRVVAPRVGRAATVRGVIAQHLSGEPIVTIRNEASWFGELYPAPNPQT
jgi:hypothetical protein